MKAEAVLPDMLDVAVPLWIMGMRHSTFEQRQARARVCAEALVGPDMGEAVLFAIKGKSAPAFNAVAESVAILAFQPGGVKLFGRLWCGRHPSARPHEGSQLCAECLAEEKAS